VLWLVSGLAECLTWYKNLGPPFIGLPTFFYQSTDDDDDDDDYDGNDDYEQDCLLIQGRPLANVCV